MATWLRAGTASFTNGSATVTLAGVDVIAAAIRQGDALHGPDGRVYEIDSIDAATQVTLASNYLGSTAATQPYAIQPTRGVVTSLYDSVQALVTSVNGYVSGVLAGLFPAGTAGAPSISKAGDTNTGIYWPAADQIAMATGGAQRALLSSTALSLSVPVTGTAVQSSAADAAAGKLLTVGAFGLGSGSPSFTGDIDDTSIARGTYWVQASATGTKPGSHTYGLVSVIGRTSDDRIWQEWASGGGDVWVRFALSDVWSTWAKIFHQRSILGTVSQASGVPTGAVIERGSNANGEYVRLADGTQICDVRLASSSSATVTWTFPASFVSAPQVTATVNTDGGRMAATTGSTSTSVNFSVWSTTQTRVDAISTSLIAIGRWF